MPRFVVGVIGRGEDASPADQALAEELGACIAREAWVLLTGGRDVGIMQAASRGARSVPGSLTVGILPNVMSRPSPYVDVCIITDMNEARNNVIVLSSNVIVACGHVGPGTASEIGLAIKAGKTVLMLGGSEHAHAFFGHLSAKSLITVQSVQETIALIKTHVHRMTE